MRKLLAVLAFNFLFCVTSQASSILPKCEGKVRNWNNCLHDRFASSTFEGTF